MTASQFIRECGTEHLGRVLYLAVLYLSDMWVVVNSCCLPFTICYKIDSMLCYVHRTEPFVYLLVLLNASMWNLTLYDTEILNRAIFSQLFSLLQVQK